MTGRSAAMTIDALRNIYKRSPLRWPNQIHCDEGSEFQGEFNKEMLKHQIRVRRGIPGNHRSQGIGDNFNKLFAYHYQCKIELYGGPNSNTEWVNRLPMVIRSFNDAIKQKHTHINKHKAITYK